VLSSLPAQAAPECGHVTLAERRIVERAVGDVAALRSFVGMTAIVYGINMVDVRENLDKWRAAVDCRAQVAATEQAARTAAAPPAGRADEIVASQR